MNEDTHKKIMEIKRGFRLLMNGVTSRSMRDKGLGYKLNWGVSLGDLQNMAQGYGKDYDLAIELWKEDIRECKILAALMMPAEKMLPEVADIWIEQTHSQEIAEITSFYVYRHLADAAILAYRWISADDEIRQICGYNVLARLFMDGNAPDERGISEFVDQALAALQDQSLSVRHSAMNAVNRFVSLGKDYEYIAEKALGTIGLELF